MSDVTLSAGVRQNLLSLQGTADMMALTQNRLATGKKVNTALDNPANFFTSQSLNNRAGDLNSLLDSIGQAQKTLEAADRGITSLTKLVESAKASAKQARQTAQASSTFSAVNANSIAPAEVLATRTATADMSPVAIAISDTTQTQIFGTLTGDTLANAVVAGTNDILIDVTVGATTTTVTVPTATTVGQNAAGVAAAIQTAINASAVGAGKITVTSGGGGFGAITMTAADYDVDFSTQANLTANEVGLTADNVTPRGALSTSLLDRVVAAGGAAGVTNLSIAVNGNTPAVKVFGNGAGQISTLAELNAWLLTVNTGGLQASAVSGAIDFDLGAGATNNLTITSNLTTAVDTALGTGVLGSYNSAPTLLDLNPALTTGGNFVISLDKNDGGGYATQTVGILATDRIDDIVTKLKANASLDDNLNIVNANGFLKITAKTSDIDFRVTDNAVAQAVGMTTGGGNITVNSTSLLDQMTAGGVVDGDTLTLGVNGGSPQTIAFGVGVGKISTSAEFATALSNLNAMTANLVGTALNVQVASASSATSLTIGGATAVVGALNLTAGTTFGTETLGANNTTRASLQDDYNKTLAAIDDMAKDASYSGINLINGDDLKITFNEDGSSSLTLQGVVFDTIGLNIPTANGNGFQDDAIIETTLAALDGALSTLRTQASKFGSNLTTVQTRQDFTKGLINTLQTGGDALVLADSNEEGANMLALQTRQQLSTTALSLSAQADQAVLRLFG